MIHIATALLSAGPLQESFFEAVKKAGRHACLQALYTCLAEGADVNAKRGIGLTALHWAAWKNPDPAAVRAVTAALVAEGADVRAKDQQGAERLHWAGWNNNAEAATAAVLALVAAGADLRARCKDGAEPRPLHTAALCGNAAGAAAAVQALVAAGADVRAKDRDSDEPQHAAQNSNAEAAAMAVQALVAAGADVRARRNDGAEPLHRAALNGNGVAANAAVQALVTAGAAVRARDKHGSEPLHAAAMNNKPAAAVMAARALLEAGACRTAVNRDGCPPWLLVLERPDAAQCGQLLQLLLPPGELHLSSPALQRLAVAAGALPAGAGSRLLAAVIHQLLSPSQPAGAEAQNRKCVVCWDAPRSVALLPCGHLALCARCAERQDVRERCPVCRNVCTGTVTIYHP